jgi:hypothetical protein
MEISQEQNIYSQALLSQTQWDQGKTSSYTSIQNIKG